MIGPVLAALAGALIVGGVLLAVWGSRPQPVKPAVPARQGRIRRAWMGIPRRRRWAALAAAAVGLAVGLITGWMLVVVVLPAIVLWLPSILMTSDEGRTIAKLEALSEWTRNLAGVMVAGQGIEGAINANVRSAPEAIRAQVGRLSARLRARWSTEAALRAFADDLEVVTGDLVASALILGAAKRGDGLAAILTGLSESVAEDVRARRQIEADRAKPRSTARTVTLISTAALVALAFTGQFLAPYHSVVGQLVLGGLLLGFAGCLLWLRRLSQPTAANRLLGEAARAGALR